MPSATQRRSKADERLDPDDIYRQIGLVVVAFQTPLETTLMQIGWMATEPSHAADGRGALAEMGFSQLVTATARRVDAFVAGLDIGHDEFRRNFLSNFHQLLTSCRDVARQRNRTVHSAYIHIEGGDQLVGIMRSDMRKAADGPGVDFDQELLTPSSFDAFLQEIARVAIGLSHSKVQLAQWVRRPRS